MPIGKYVFQSIARNACQSCHALPARDAVQPVHAYPRRTALPHIYVRFSSGLRFAECLASSSSGPVNGAQLAHVSGYSNTSHRV
jgi:hypothetical protein